MQPGKKEKHWQNKEKRKAFKSIPKEICQIFLKWKKNNYKFNTK